MDALISLLQIDKAYGDGPEGAATNELHEIAEDEDEEWHNEAAAVEATGPVTSRGVVDRAKDDHLNERAAKYRPERHETRPRKALGSREEQYEAPPTPSSPKHREAAGAEPSQRRASARHAKQKALLDASDASEREQAPRGVIPSEAYARHTSPDRSPMNRSRMSLEKVARSPTSPRGGSTQPVSQPDAASEATSGATGEEDSLGLSNGGARRRRNRSTAEDGTQAMGGRGKEPQEDAGRTSRTVTQRWSKTVPPGVTDATGTSAEEEGGRVRAGRSAARRVAQEEEQDDFANSGQRQRTAHRTQHATRRQKGSTRTEDNEEPLETELL
jgi:hypothetical protein